MKFIKHNNDCLIKYSNDKLEECFILILSSTYRDCFMAIADGQNNLMAV